MVWTYGNTQINQNNIILIEPTAKSTVKDREIEVQSYTSSQLKTFGASMPKHYLSYQVLRDIKISKH